MYNASDKTVFVQFMKRKRDVEQQDETDSSQTHILIGERWVVPDVTSSRAGLAIHINISESHNKPPQ